MSDAISLQAKLDAANERIRQLERDTIPSAPPIHMLTDRGLFEELLERQRQSDERQRLMERELNQVGKLAREIAADQKLTNKAYGLLGQRMSLMEERCGINHGVAALQAAPGQDEIGEAERSVVEAQEA